MIDVNEKNYIDLIKPSISLNTVVFWRFPSIVFMMFLYLESTALTLA